jgi:hypothetical protein
MFRLYRACCHLMAVFLCSASYLSAQVADAGEDIRGPKEMVVIPVPEKPPYLLWSCIAGGVLLLVAATILWKRRTKKQRLNTPLEVALASLTALERNREALAAEAFANRAAQTVRHYIAEHFGLAAPRRTTEEFLRELAKDDGSILTGQTDHLRAFLKSCDLAKFAGSNLDASQRGELIEAARGFIRSTSKAVSP